MATKLNKENEKNVIEALNEIKAQPNMNVGVEEIEFPDGTTEKFYYNGEDDKQAAIKFASICVNATPNTAKAKQMMFICFQLLTKGINPDKIVKVEDDEGVYEYYLDGAKGILVNIFGNTVVSLTEDELKLNLPIEAIEIILKERLKREE